MDEREAHEIHKQVATGIGTYAPGYREGCLNCDLEPVPTNCPKCHRRLKFHQWSRYPTWRCDGMRGNIPLLGRFWRALNFAWGRHYTFALPVKE